LPKPEIDGASAEEMFKSLAKEKLSEEDFERLIKKYEDVKRKPKK
jgi:hypothetical protein